MAKPPTLRKKTKPAPRTKTRSLRFAPDPGTIAELQFKRDDGTVLSLYGLVLNESRSGCAAVVVTDQTLEEDTVCTCRVGQLPKTIAAVRWVKKVEKDLLKLGLEYDL